MRSLSAHTAFFNFQKVPRRFKSAFALSTFHLLLSKPLFVMRSKKGHQLPCKRFAVQIFDLKSMQGLCPWLFPEGKPCLFEAQDCHPLLRRSISDHASAPRLILCEAHACLCKAQNCHPKSDHDQALLLFSLLWNKILFSKRNSWEKWLIYFVFF